MPQLKQPRHLILFAAVFALYFISDRLKMRVRTTTSSMSTPLINSNAKAKPVVKYNADRKRKHLQLLEEQGGGS